MFVGDITPDLCSRARSHDDRAQIITSANFQGLAPGTYYTSLGDLADLNQLSAVLRQADVIVYSPPAVWSNRHIKDWTEDYLEIFSCISNKKIMGFDRSDATLSPMSELADQRQSPGQQIWIAGCSISHGYGIGLDERWGALVAKELGMPVSFLTAGSASVSWAADQILRSDVRSGDLVFWGLTSIHRFSFWNHDLQKVMHCTSRDWVQQEHKRQYLSSIIKENFLASDTLVYQAINSVNCVNNFCDKIGAVLILGTVLRGLEQAFRDWPNFVVMAGTHGRNSDDMFIDIGNDGVHPGRQSHQYYAHNMLMTLANLQKIV